MDLKLYEIINLEQAIDELLNMIYLLHLKFH